MWWAPAMVTFPKVRHRAQAELDSVVGRAHLPTFANALRLRYLHRIIKEVLRWKPTAERGIHHHKPVLVEDDWHERACSFQKARLAA
jgi:cytochrome P450